MSDIRDYGADARRLGEAEAFAEWTLARVCSQHKNMYDIIDRDGERKRATVSGRFSHEAAYDTDYPVVGDFVMAECVQGDPERAIIHRVLTRRSVFERRAVGNEHGTQIIAANIDVLFICMSLNENYNLARMERYLSSAWNSGATPVAVLTKADLASDANAAADEIRSVAPGTDVILTTSMDASTAKRVMDYIKPGITASFTGSSGVGKSTLINMLAGEELLETSEISAYGRGRHTTTSRELILLPGGGVVIDTPGMRELGVDAVDLSKSFADIDALASRCRFADCTHTREPGCAVRAAIEAGELDGRRLESYIKLKGEAKYDGLDSRQIDKKKTEGMAKNAGGVKNLRKYIRENDKRNG